MNINKKRQFIHEIHKAFPKTKAMVQFAEGEDALLFKKKNNVYRYTKTSSLEAAHREMDICRIAAENGLFPMLRMPTYDEDSKILEIKIENMDGTFYDLKNEIQRIGGGEAEMKYKQLLNKLISKIKDLNNLGICHGDLNKNPNNIMYKGSLRDYKLYIIDFTTARENVKGCTNLNLKSVYTFHRTQARTNQMKTPTTKGSLLDMFNRAA